MSMLVTVVSENLFLAADIACFAERWQTNSPLLPAAYMSSPCHIELTLTEKDSSVKAEAVSILWHSFHCAQHTAAWSDSNSRNQNGSSTLGVPWRWVDAANMIISQQMDTLPGSADIRQGSSSPGSQAQAG